MKTGIQTVWTKIQPRRRENTLVFFVPQTTFLWQIFLFSSWCYTMFDAYLLCLNTDVYAVFLLGFLFLFLLYPSFKLSECVLPHSIENRVHKSSYVNMYNHDIDILVHVSPVSLRSNIRLKRYLNFVCKP